MGGGYAEPILVSLPERDRVGQLRRMADEVEEVFGARPSGAWLAERVWEPDLPTSLVAGGCGLDDPRRRPLPGGGHPGGRSVGPVPHRGPGPADHGLRDRAGAALPDPVAERRGRHRLPARARHRGRVAGRDDGRRRREVRGVADDLGALLGRGRLGGAVLRGARGERRLADDRDAERLAGRAPADRPRLRADRLLRGDGRMGAAARGGRGLRGRGARGEGRTSAGAALAARGVVAQLPGQVPRGQRPPQADAPRVREGRGDGRRAGPRSRPRSPLPGPVERLLLARAVRRRLHQPHAARDARAPDRGRGPRGSGGRGARRGRDAGPRPRRRRRGTARDRRAGGDRRPRGRRGRRRLGRPRGTARGHGRPAAAARGLPRQDHGRRRRRGHRGG